MFVALYAITIKRTVLKLLRCMSDHNCDPVERNSGPYVWMKAIVYFRDRCCVATSDSVWLSP